VTVEQAGDQFGESGKSRLLIKPIYLFSTNQSNRFFFSIPFSTEGSEEFTSFFRRVKAFKTFFFLASFATDVVQRLRKKSIR
jgi:hypothetical protein